VNDAGSNKRLCTDAGREIERSNGWRREPAPFFCASIIAAVACSAVTGAACGSGVPDGSDADTQLTAG
jgi:hypothetical protein